jgi:hypothetical protein
MSVASLGCFNVLVTSPMDFPKFHCSYLESRGVRKKTREIRGKTREIISFHFRFRWPHFRWPHFRWRHFRWCNFRWRSTTTANWAAPYTTLNPKEHIWDMLGRRMQAREPPVQNIRQLEAALHRKWQQLSQQDIRIYTGLVASGWLSEWGTTTGCKTSLMYWSPVRLPCMVTKSRLQSWEILPKPLLSHVHCWQTDIDDHAWHGV